MEDKAIIDLCFARSEQAVTCLVEKYRGLIYQTSYRILQNREDAEECLNDVYLGVWNSIPPNQPEYLPAYICRIARNIAIKKLQKKNRQCRSSEYTILYDELENLISGQNVEESIAEKELEQEINEFLASLKSKDRTLFVNRYWFGYSIHELSQIYGMSENHVSVKLSRIRRKLKSVLQERGRML